VLCSATELWTFTTGLSGFADVLMGCVVALKQLTRREGQESGTGCVVVLNSELFLKKVSVR
jgi:hypothetical protein